MAWSVVISIGQSIVEATSQANCMIETLTFGQVNRCHEGKDKKSFFHMKKFAPKVCSSKLTKVLNLLPIIEENSD